MRPVTHERRSQTAEYHVNGNSNREQETCCHNVHTRQGIHGRGPANWTICERRWRSSRCNELTEERAADNEDTEERVERE